MPRHKSSRAASVHYGQETRMAHLVLPSDTNHYGTLFGGTALAWMDIAAAIAAIRTCRKEVVTASSERVDFDVPVKAGSLVEVISRVVEVGRSSLKVSVELYVEDMFTGRRERCTHGMFTMVAVDKKGKPISARAGKRVVA